MTAAAREHPHLPRLRRLLVEHLGVEPEQVTAAATLHEDLSADSLDVYEIVMAIEDAFALEITDAEAEACKAVSDILALLDRHQAAVVVP